MAENKNEYAPRDEWNIDLYSIVTDICHEWMTILFFCIAAALLTRVVVTERYQPTYTTQATLYVTKRGTQSTIYDNQYSAETMATKFEQILNSNLLQKKVAQEVGLSFFQGSATAEVIPETNLISLKVTSYSPGMCFKLINSIMRNYGVVSDYMVGDAILETLQAPEIPVSPDYPLNAGDAMKKAFFYTAAALCLLIAVFSYMRDTIRSEKDITRKLDAKNLGTLWHERKYKTLGSWIRKNKKGVLITNPTCSFRYVESARKLARHVKNKMDEKGAKTLLVTSVLENEGKSTVAANLGLALAQEAERVLLIDCDFRKPSQYKVLEMQDVRIDDLGNVLNGKGFANDLIHKAPGSNLYTILNTVAFENSTEMILSGMLQKIIDYFRESMDYIILDTSPLALVADAEEITQMVDATLLVVEEHTVEAKDLNDAIDTLNGDRKKNLGCVYNNAHVGILKSAGSYGYGYGYSYGGHYEQ